VNRKTRPFARVSVAHHPGDAIALQERGELLDNRIWAERRADLANAVQHGDAGRLAVPDRKRHAVGAAARWIDKGEECYAFPRRQLTNAVRDHGLDRLPRDEGNKISPELPSELGKRALTVLLVHLTDQLVAN
jgi:hypothetical protein